MTPEREIKSVKESTQNGETVVTAIAVDKTGKSHVAVETYRHENDRSTAIERATKNALGA